MKVLITFNCVIIKKELVFFFFLICPHKKEKMDSNYVTFALLGMVSTD
jgi:hypothetical protein